MGITSDYKVVPGADEETAEEPLLSSSHANSCQFCSSDNPRRSSSGCRWLLYHLCIAAAYMAITGVLFAVHVSYEDHIQQHQQHQQDDLDPYAYGKHGYTER